MAEVATPSFEAYRLLVQGGRLIESLRNPDAIPVLRDAVAVDPDAVLVDLGSFLTGPAGFRAGL
jgi:hypothetical protein